MTNTPISPADGPVAVTDAASYIGSWIVQDLLDNGYHARACVRNASNADKVDHLISASRDASRGVLELSHIEQVISRHTQNYTHTVTVITYGTLKQTPPLHYDDSPDKLPVRYSSMGKWQHPDIN